MLNVGVIGTGFVGLVTGACLSELGHSVVCVGTDAHEAGRLSAGEIPVEEPDLKSLVATNMARERLRFVTGIQEAEVERADVLFIALDTNGGARLNPVYRIVEEIAAALAAHSVGPAWWTKLRRGFRMTEVAAKPFTVIALKSALPVGTSAHVAGILGRHLSSGRFAVAANPELLRRASGIRDFGDPERIVIGSPSRPARRLLRGIYAPYERKGRSPIVVSSTDTAELIKFARDGFAAIGDTFVQERGKARAHMDEALKRVRRLEGEARREAVEALILKIADLARAQEAQRADLQARASDLERSVQESIQALDLLVSTALDLKDRELLLRVVDLVRVELGGVDVHRPAPPASGTT